MPCPSLPKCANTEFIDIDGYEAKKELIDEIANWPHPPREMIEECLADPSGIPILGDWMEDHGHDREWAEKLVGMERVRRNAINNADRILLRHLMSQGSLFWPRPAQGLIPKRGITEESS